MNRNRKFICVAAAGLLAIGGQVLAGVPAEDGFLIEADVIDVQPLVRVVDVTTPKEVCWEEPVYRSANNYQSKTPLVIGGIIGGVLGNEIGDGKKSKGLLTAAGALLGASIGRDQAWRHASRQSTYVTSERVCEIEQVVHQEERVDGYRVSYEYGGRTFTTHTQTDPGPTIRVRVRLQPVTYNDAVYPGSTSDRRPQRSYRYQS